jgi:hypothetical protein
LAVDPEIIFAGSRAGEVTEAAVYEKGEPDRFLYRLELVDHRATPPMATTPLTPNHRYLLKLTMSDEAQPVDYAFLAVASGGADSLIVLHVD